MLVTHGVQWLPEADVILILREGRVLEAGSYDQLVARSGPFARYLRNCLTQQGPSRDPADREGNRLTGKVTGW